MPAPEVSPPSRPNVAPSFVPFTGAAAAQGQSQAYIDSSGGNAPFPGVGGTNPDFIKPGKRYVQVDPQEELLDSVLLPGQAIYPDRSGQGGIPGGMAAAHDLPHWSRQREQVHPSLLVHGRVAVSLTSQPPSEAERRYLQTLRRDTLFENTLLTLSKNLTSKTLIRFRGSDEVTEYQNWIDAMERYFDTHTILNNALQALLALETFSDHAMVWWRSHRRRLPRLTLSFDQLKEWLCIELVPMAEPGAAHLQWADLTFDGNLDTYFQKVRTLYRYHSMPPRECQVLAARPFGQALVERIRAAAVPMGSGGLPPTQWEAIVRSYVTETEANPTFQSWGRGTLEPVRRHARLRQSRLEVCEVGSDGDDESEPEMLPDVPKGTREEVWCAMLYSGIVVGGGKQLKIGEGSSPCFKCGKPDHGWIRCPMRKQGKCGVCGSDEHYTRFCAHRFHPDPKAPIIPRPGPKSKPNAPFPHAASTSRATRSSSVAPTKLRKVVVSPTEDDEELDEEEVKESADLPISEVTSEAESTSEEAATASDHVHLRQVCLQPELTTDAPRWVKEMLKEPHHRQRIGKGTYPLKDPRKAQQLYYAARVDGRPGTMLYDLGASHSFVDLRWIKKHGLKTFTNKMKTEVHLFIGVLENAVPSLLVTKRFCFAGATYSWRFLAIDPAPSDLVLGMDFFVRHRPLLDVMTFRLWATAPTETLTSPKSLVDDREDQWDSTDQVVAHDVPEIGHLRGLKIFSLGSDFPYAPYWDNGRVHLFSVTANTVDEAEQLEDFYKILDSELLTVVRKHDKVFAPPDKEPPRREITHEIKLVCEAAPIKRRPYPLPPHKLDAMRTQISDLANNGWIEPSVSPWGAPILFVPKKSGELRLCVDFRDLNSVTVDDCFPLPRIDVMLYKARDATLFSTLDLASGFHQIEVEGNSRPLTAFRLPEAVDGSSLWQWKVMPFGLRNAPPTFQRAMTRALNGLDHCATVYIDDILIFSRDKKEHLQHLDQVFTALGRHQYHVRLQKCEFLQKEVKFLGHKLTPEGGMHPERQGGGFERVENTIY